MPAPIETVLSRLSDAISCGEGKWKARCPAHDDRHPSLSIGVGDDGRVLLHCHAGCNQQSIITALGLKTADLFVPKPNGHAGPKRSPRVYPSVGAAAKEVARREKGEVEAVYRYTDDYNRVRIRKPDGKSFRPIRREGDGWVLGDPPGKLPLYHRDELAGEAAVCVCEGEKATDAARRLGLLATTSGSSSSAPKADWTPLAGRNVVLLPDNDPPGEKYARAVAAELHKLKPPAVVRIVRLPDLPDKGDIYDYVEQQGGRPPAEIRALVEQIAEQAPIVADEPEPDAPAVDCPYEATSAGLVWMKPTNNGLTPTPLTTFTARIAAQVTHDDGVETHRVFEIEATQAGRTHKFTVSASQFGAMNWPVEHVGCDAIVFPGFNAKEHARTAIQMLSPNRTDRTVYTHTGWREIGNVWAYLHAGGAIGPVGPLSYVETALPSGLDRYELPNPPTGDDLKVAVRASLKLLDLAPDAIMVPLFCLPWRAVLGPGAFSVHLAGQTGTGKSELAALVQQHFGAAMTAKALPASWSSTGNALEGLAFVAKDAVLVVDDFAPTGSIADVQRFHRDADHLLRAQGNRSGRQRMRADATLRPVKAPRGLILSTGEDVPRGHSVRARTLVLEVGPRDLDWAQLTKCQANAAAGKYAAALAGFLRWLASRYDAVAKSLPDEVAELRGKTTQSGQHKRTPEIVADLLVGLRYFLTFAVESGAISADEDHEFWSRAWVALGQAAAAQAAHHQANDPVVRFMELLSSAIASGHAHLAGPDGLPPRCAGEEEYPAGWGWRLKKVGTGVNERDEWQPQGDRVGWIDNNDVYLEPDASYRVAQIMGGGSDGLPVGVRTLHKRLKEHGLLVEADERRGRLTVRHMLEGQRRSVLHLHTDSLMSLETAQAAQPAHEPAPDAQDKDSRDSKWAGSGRAESGNGPQNGPLAAPECGFGPVGPVGPVSQTYNTQPCADAREEAEV